VTMKVGTTQTSKYQVLALACAGVVGLAMGLTQSVNPLASSGVSAPGSSRADGDSQDTESSCFASRDRNCDINCSGPTKISKMGRHFKRLDHFGNGG